MAQQGAPHAPAHRRRDARPPGLREPARRPHGPRQLPGPAPRGRDPRDAGTPTAGPSCATRRGSRRAILKDNAEELVDKVVPDASREMNLRAARAALQRGRSLRRHDDPGQLRRRRPADLPGAPRSRRADGAPLRLALRRVHEAPRRSRRSHRPGRRLDPPGRPQDPLRRLDGLRAPPRSSSRTSTIPRPRGLLLHPVESSTRLIREADAAGFQLAVHAIGDRANALVLDAFEKAARANPVPRAALAHRARPGRARRGRRPLQGAGRGRVDPAVPLHRRHAVGRAARSATTAAAGPTASAPS